MPAIPEIWIEGQTISEYGPGTTSPVITQLTSGGIIVGWARSNAVRAGSQRGIVLVARHPDYLGTVVGADFRLTIFATAGDEGMPQIRALAGGGLLRDISKTPHRQRHAVSKI